MSPCSNKKSCVDERNHLKFLWSGQFFYFCPKDCAVSVRFTFKSARLGEGEGQSTKHCPTWVVVFQRLKKMSACILSNTFADRNITERRPMAWLNKDKAVIGYIIQGAKPRPAFLLGNYVWNTSHRPRKSSDMIKQTQIPPGWYSP